MNRRASSKISLKIHSRSKGRVRNTRVGRRMLIKFTARSNRSFLALCFYVSFFILPPSATVLTNSIGQFEAGLWVNFKHRGNCELNYHYKLLRDSGRRTLHEYLWMQCMGKVDVCMYEYRRARNEYAISLHLCRVSSLSFRDAFLPFTLLILKPLQNLVCFISLLYSLLTFNSTR